MEHKEMLLNVSALTAATGEVVKVKKVDIKLKETDHGEWQECDVTMVVETSAVSRDGFITFDSDAKYSEMTCKSVAKEFKY